MWNKNKTKDKIQVIFYIIMWYYIMHNILFNDVNRNIEIRKLKVDSRRDYLSIIQHNIENINL